MNRRGGSGHRVRRQLNVRSPCAPGPHDASALLDRCPVLVNELPAPVPPNEHAGPATLLIHLPLLIRSLCYGTTGEDCSIAEDTDFDLVRCQRLEIYAPGLAVLEILCPILD